MQEILSKAVSKLMEVALAEDTMIVVVPCLKNVPDEMSAAYDAWEKETFEQPMELYGAFMDGAFFSQHPEENADDPQVQKAFKAGRIWRLAKEGEVAAAIGIRAVAICSELGCSVI